jgi:S1-C subfamily serine protease
VVEVAAGGPAERAGLEPAAAQRSGRRIVFNGGDVIVAADGQPIQRRDELTIYLENEKRVGDTVDLTVVRDQETITLTLRLGEMPR